jgi:hypothetical protein
MFTKAARIFGIVFLLIGVLGFIPAATPNGLFGLFHVDTWHNVIHLVFGAWGLLAAGSRGGAIAYLKGVAVVYAILTVLGLIPSTRMLFDRIALGGANVWLHAGLAVVAAYIGIGLAENFPEKG